MFPTRRLMHAGHGCGKTTALVDAAADIFRAGVDRSRFLALGVQGRGVQPLRDRLRQRLGHDIPTAEVRRRAGAILQQFPQAAGLHEGWSSAEVLSALDRRLLMRRAWSSMGPSSLLYGRYGQNPGAIDWLARVFDAFAEWSGSADPVHLDRVRPSEAALAELWAAYRRYLELGQEHGLVAFQEVIPRAVDALRDPAVRQEVAPDVVLLDDLDLFRPSELLFVQALLDPATSVIATAALPPANAGDDAELGFLDDWCARHGLIETHDDRHNPGPALRHVEYPTPQAEVDAIAGYISSTFTEGRRFADYAVVVFDPQLAPLLRRTLPHYGVAVEGMESRDARCLAAAPVIVAGMSLLGGQPLPADELAALLHHPLLGLPAADAHLLATSLVGHSSRTRAPRSINLLSIREAQWPAALSPGGRQWLRLLYAVTEALRAENMPPGDKLVHWLEALDVPPRMEDLAGQALEPWAAAAEAQLLDRWLALLEQAQQTRLALGEPLSEAEAVDVLREGQLLVEPFSRPLRDAVQIWSPNQLGSCSARSVWLAGLHEAALPARAAPLPWCAPEIFGELDELPGFVPPQHDDRAGRWARASADLARAIGRAGAEAILSWSSHDADGRRRLPSPVLLPRMDAIGDRSNHVQAMAPGSPILASRSVPAQVECRRPPCGPRLHLPREPVQTSASAIESFLLCPRQHYYARVLNLFDVSSTPRQALGQVVHAALLELKRAGRSAGEAETLIDAHWPAGDPRWGTPLREAALRRQAIEAVANVVADEVDQAETEFVAGEVRFTWQIAPDVELRGSIDRIDRGPEGLVVLDYKLGAESPSLVSLLNKFAPPRGDSAEPWRPSDLQLPLYALAAEGGTLDAAPVLQGERVAQIGLVYPLQLFTDRGKRSEKGRRMVRIVDHEDDCAACRDAAPPPKSALLCHRQLSQIRERALTAVEEIRSGCIDPAPRDGPDTCRSCPFWVICPAPQR